MPELPEVETTRRGLYPHLVGRRVTDVVVRRAKLRWPVAEELQTVLPGQVVNAIERRAKYLLVHTAAGSPLLHLGMSGSLRVLPAAVKPELHDHVDWCLDNGHVLRFNDPRRFGCQLWQAPGTLHPLLQDLGPEPLGDDFSGRYLWNLSRARKAAVKLFLMDQRVVVGVGNIYAAEALYAAGIHPARAAGKVSAERYDRLAAEVRRILAYAIERGGTTLRDFISPDGQPGYFEQELFVYGRAGEPCRLCGGAVRSVTLGQRSTFYCARCQR
ncbi:bifunctional DNA-formamidopyrimidine glycosylase/DNA-(apurinic or apyrimidinic site) lyase [Tahibacter amnicola]|uniref:Formamidopyrimidine-DNA glycosylase n=1 Tax=Tahibacter amnicola TaxID=2976241 RepID=A0ABY6BGE7_9GAMM|nr:bifunctional DNA-formamidopyrimidine glycosylase/DNA-(apurinic or apyrimidinic site) lyase [Tahibacter amnicola]UXI68587.1 bifunctional DNA-formamidopyrimidine glycosylase/DNA-(apurinic or apyrimidinic site) lyase [Tahibacter amnicola]